MDLQEEGIGFVAISQALAENGIAAVRFDFSGCGASVVPFSQFNLKNNISDSNVVVEFFGQKLEPWKRIFR